MKKFAFLAIALLAAIAAVSSFADERKPRGKSEQEEVREALRRGELLPLSQILPIALAKVPGDVIKVELEREEGVLIYEIKILAANGRVREIKLDAKTAQVLQVEDD